MLHTVYIQSYDGTGKGATITNDKGEVLNPRTVTVYMEPDSVNRADMEFVLVAVDVKAAAGSLTFLCPVCEDELSHECNENATMGGL